MTGVGISNTPAFKVAAVPEVPVVVKLANGIAGNAIKLPSPLMY